MAAKKKDTKVTIQNPDAPMTDKQTYKLYMITGVTMFYMDVYPYTKGEASALIDRALNGEAYHVRVETAQHEGSKVSWTDVGKGYREDTKPKGYKVAMDMLSEDPEEPEEVQGETDPDEIAALEAQLKELKEQKSAPENAPKGKTKFQKLQSLKAKYERELKALEEQEDTPPPAKVKKNKNHQSSDNNAKSMAVITKLANDTGVDVEKLIRMAAAFSA